MTGVYLLWSFCRDVDFTHATSNWSLVSHDLPDDDSKRVQISTRVARLIQKHLWSSVRERPCTITSTVTLNETW